ncbi:MAG: PP2C family protein-serine/threonine phosphatase [Ignavibacterium sp.]|jgi:sigma-B regulation protein RsbU (phosphoserine phosphatase)|nr:PP2C family protein-serine/threonine phosphatase [Ignavibacterium sp.]
MCPKSLKEEEQLSKENLRLKSAVEELSILNDIATAIASTQSIGQITNLIVKKCVKHLKSEQGSIQLVDEKDFVNPFHTMIRVKDSQRGMQPLRFDQQISDWMLANKKPMIRNEFKHEEKIALQGDSILKIRSMLSVPMIIKGRMIGILTLFNKESVEGFTETDQRLLTIIAGQSANVIENSRLFEEEQKLMQIQQEIRVASEIQKNLLPKEIPSIEGYDIYAINIPAREVGGDYYDFIKISETKTAIALGDVSGKGLPASMLMANLQATLRGQLSFCNCAKDCINRANNMLFKSTDTSKFVTLFFGILDSEKHTLTYCNAGHNEPVFMQSNKKMKLDKGGMLLSIFEHIDYDEEEVLFDKGSTLIVFTDGITEAMNAKEEEYGDNRLEDLIERNSKLNSKELIIEILDDVKNHSAGVPQFDDITLMVIKRNK